MRNLHYLRNGGSLAIDPTRCTGCGACLEVCPHGVLALEPPGDGDSKSGALRATVRDRQACMECGACALNCPAGAIAVSSGVGCAQAIIIGKLRGTAPDCSCGGKGGGCCG